MCAKGNLVTGASDSFSAYFGGSSADSSNAPGGEGQEDRDRERDGRGFRKTGGRTGSPQEAPEPANWSGVNLPKESQ